MPAPERLLLPPTATLPSRRHQDRSVNAWPPPEQRPPLGRYAPNASPQGAGRIRGERPAAYNYVGAELRRIGVLSVSVIAVLVVLGILL